MPFPPVALLAEGVDRNQRDGFGELFDSKSPSSRRAWIEISSAWSWMRLRPVALLAEGVDRNSNRIWPRIQAQVALLAEGVDRNKKIEVTETATAVALLAEGVDRNTP